ncbi:MAG: helix-turn-helix domain-containing protein [Nitrospirota bacterium]
MRIKDFYCPNKECRDYGKKGGGNITFYDIYGKRGRRLLRCKTCNFRFSERRNSIFFRLHTDEVTILKALRYLAEGNSIRTTAKLTGIDKDTVYRIFERVRTHYRDVLNRLLDDLNLEEFQLDELLFFLKRIKS